MNKRLTKVSKYLSFILSHEPGSIGLSLDEQGFVDVKTLVQKANESGKSITEEQVRQVIEQSEEQRFVLSDDGERIRAVAKPAKETKPANETKPADESKPSKTGEFKPSPWNRS